MFFGLRLHLAQPPCPSTKATQTDLRLPPAQGLRHLARHAGWPVVPFCAFGSVRLVPPYSAELCKCQCQCVRPVQLLAWACGAGCGALASARRPGACIIEPGGAARFGGTLGPHRSRASTPREIDADRATGSQLRGSSALTPSSICWLYCTPCSPTRCSACCSWAQHSLADGAPAGTLVASHSTAQDAAAAVDALCAAAPHAAAAMMSSCTHCQCPSRRR